MLSPAPMDVPSRSHPITFTDGQFRGRTLRFRLELAQEPSVGRKSGDKDRRPLANVPIVRLWLWELSSDGRETKVDENHVDPSSLYCSVDLCSPSSVATHPAAPGPGLSSSGSSQSNSQPHLTHPHLPHHPPSSNPHHPSHTSSAGQQPSSSASRPPSLSATHPTPFHRRNHAKVASGPPRGGHATSTPSSGTPSGSGNGSTSGSTSGSSGQASGSSGTTSSVGTTTQSSGDGGSNIDQWPPEQHRRQTTAGKTVRNIFGNLVSPAVCLTDLNNDLGFWFVYQDIAIRTEGVYSLRFSLFDVDSRTPDSLSHAPILAECFSGPITIYAPRNHPGVPPSTKLAKHFVSQGYRLTIKKGGDSSSNSSSRRAPPTEGAFKSSSHKRRAKRQDVQSGSSEEASESPPPGSEEDEIADAVGADEEGIGTDDTRAMVS